jgi:hypothetical protein
MLPASCLLLLSVALVTTLGRYPDFSLESTTVRSEPTPDFL